MANPLIPKKYDTNKKFIDLPKSKGILDDFAVRKDVHSRNINASNLTASKVVVSDANKNLASGTNTDAQISSAVTASHTQNTDTALGSGCVALDHGTAATDMVVNVCYGTGAPPTASTTTEGTIFLQYTA